MGAEGDAHRAVPHVTRTRAPRFPKRAPSSYGRYVQLLPWTMLNGSIHRPPPAAAPFAPAEDVTTVRWAAAQLDATGRLLDPNLAGSAASSRQATAI